MNIDAENYQPDSCSGSKVIIIKQIEFAGNKKTRENILLRELQFAQGDTLLEKEFNSAIIKSHDNLINTSLFNFVTFSIEKISASAQPDSVFQPVKIKISLTERWYTWPFPIFQIKERNFNSWLKNKSITDVTYGFFLQQNNFRGRKERLLLTLLYGYDQKAGLTYEKPYINKKQTIGFVCSAFFTRNHSASYTSYMNKVQNARFLDDFILNNVIVTTRFTYRRDFHVYHSLAINYTRLNFSDTLLKLNPDFIFGKMKHPDFWGFTYRFKVDFRDYQPYPLKGWFFDTEIDKVGIDFVGGQKPDLFSMKNSLRKYLELSPRFHYAAGLSSKYSFGQYVPYYFQRALGYDNDYVRGYEYYVIDGQDFVLVKNNFKWTILPTKEKNLPFIKTEKFSRIHYTIHMNIFGDFAYVNDRTLNNSNLLANRWISGFGVGFDFVTYYDKVFRFEFSRNNKGESGFFLNFVSPI